jgi:hypothetical protein
VLIRYPPREVLMLLIVPAFFVTFCVIVIVAVVQTIVERRRLNRLPPAPPILCPECGSSEQTVATYFMWDGAPDPVTGDRPNGDCYYATCSSCGSRIAQHDQAAPFVLSGEEWRSVLELSGRSAGE